MEQERREELRKFKSSDSKLENFINNEILPILETDSSNINDIENKIREFLGEFTLIDKE